NLAVLDLIFAKAKYAEELKASEPVLHDRKDERRKKDGESTSLSSPAMSRGEGFVFHITRARHPLLDPNTVVPIDVDPRPGTRAIIITGPNTGGKTVSLKTVG